MNAPGKRLVESGRKMEHDLDSLGGPPAVLRRHQISGDNLDTLCSAMLRDHRLEPIETTRWPDEAAHPLAARPQQGRHHATTDEACRSRD